MKYTNYIYNPFFNDNDIKTYDASCSPDIYYKRRQAFSNLTNSNDLFAQCLSQSMEPLYEQDFSEDFDKDMDYMKYLYPQATKNILALVEDECDRLEYDGSVMFDDFPDKVSLGRIVDRIYERMQYASDDNDVNTESLDNWGPRPCSGPGCCPSGTCYPDFIDGRPNWRRSLIESILFNEIIHRRRRRRDRKKWF